jgi:hypothetical protein
LLYTARPTFAVKKRDTWHYYDGNIKLFESKFQPALSGGLFLVCINGLYNYLDDKGNLVLSKNYKWISNNGKIAITEKDNVVFLLKGKKELTYY